MKTKNQIAAELRDLAKELNYYGFPPNQTSLFFLGRLTGESRTFLEHYFANYLGINQFFSFEKEHLVMVLCFAAAVAEDEASEEGTLKWAASILEKIEYSSDGFIKRYPEEEDYEKAMAIVKSLVEAK